MSVAVAIFFLVEATTACGPAAPARLAGGAEVVRAILDFEEQAPEPPAPTPAGVSQATDEVLGDAKIETDEPDSDSAPAQCKPVPMPIA